MKRTLPILIGAPLALLLSSCGGGSQQASQTALPSAQKSSPAPAAEAALESPSGGRRRRHRGPRGQGESASGGRNTPGTFDFYVMSLSWSPGFCASPAGRNDNIQCGGSRQFAFVLHGLWPQFEPKGWPQDCSAEGVDDSIVKGMLDIMPSPRLVQHEWGKHGTCSGLSAKDYFEEAREAFAAVKIPEKYKAPSRQIMIDPDQMRADFAGANPKFGDRGFAVLCSGNGRFLQEVRACLTKDLEGRACNKEVINSACRSNEVIMQPLR